MRISMISSSICSVVSRVIASVAVAGSVVRVGLHLTHLREHGFREVFGDWRTSKPRGRAAATANYADLQASCMQPGAAALWMQRLLGMPCLRHCPAPVEIRRQTSIEAGRRG